MHPTVMMRLSDALLSVPLKEMDGTLLSSFVRRESAARGLNEHRVGLALDVMAYCHRSQTRMNRGPHSTTAYAEHPVRVAARLLRWGVSREALIVAALLHDVVEDAPSAGGSGVQGRVGRGVPAGGQFASVDRAEAAVSLT